MALSDTELEKVKYYLGYTNLTTIALAYFDIPAIFETVVRTDLSPWAEGQIRNVILPNLDQIDDDIFGARSRYKAKQAGEITLNPEEHSRLLDLRDFWIGRLESLTAIKRNNGPGGSSNVVTEVY